MKDESVVDRGRRLDRRARVLWDEWTAVLLAESGDLTHLGFPELQDVLQVAARAAGLTLGVLLALLEGQVRLHNGVVVGLDLLRDVSTAMLQAHDMVRREAEKDDEEKDDEEEEDMWWPD